MKRMKKMLLLLAALVVLLGCYMLAGRTTETESVNEETGTFELTAKTAEDLTALSWEDDGISYSFRHTGDVWEMTSNAAYPVATDEVEEIGRAHV